MKLDRITLENFRQYYGRQRLSFAKDRQQLRDRYSWGQRGRQDLALSSHHLVPLREEDG